MLCVYTVRTFNLPSVRKLTPEVDQVSGQVINLPLSVSRKMLLNQKLHLKYNGLMYNIPTTCFLMTGSNLRIVLPEGTLPETAFTAAPGNAMSFSCGKPGSNQVTMTNLFMEDDADTDDESEPIVVTALDDDGDEQVDDAPAAAATTSTAAGRGKNVSKRGRKRKQPGRPPRAAQSSPPAPPAPALPSARFITGASTAGESRRGRKRKATASNIQTLNAGFDSLTAIFQHLKTLDLMR